MTFEHRPNSGALFVNKKKEKENSPDYVGNGLINGKEMQIAGWKREGKNGTFLSLAFSVPREKDEGEF